MQNSFFYVHQTHTDLSLFLSRFSLAYGEQIWTDTTFMYSACTEREDIYDQKESVNIALRRFIFLSRKDFSGGCR